MRLTIATFLFPRPAKWLQLGYEPYAARHVNALWRACADNIRVPHRFVCYSTKPAGIECERREIFPTVRIRRPDGVSFEDGCYTRLRLYDPEIQAELGTEFVLILDLDMVFMQDATALIEGCMEDDFTALEGSKWPDGHPCSWYNGSFQLCRSGARPQFWRDFDTKRFYAQRQAYRMPNGKRPHGTDQAWLSVCAGDGEHTIGPADGVYQFRTVRQAVPADAVILFFSGKYNPWQDFALNAAPAVAARWARYDLEGAEA